MRESLSRNVTCGESDRVERTRAEGQEKIRFRKHTGEVVSKECITVNLVPKLRY